MCVYRNRWGQVYIMSYHFLSFFSLLRLSVCLVDWFARFRWSKFCGMRLPMVRFLLFSFITFWVPVGLRFDFPKNKNVHSICIDINYILFFFASFARRRISPQSKYVAQMPILPSFCWNFNIIAIIAFLIIGAHSAHHHSPHTGVIVYSIRHRILTYVRRVPQSYSRLPINFLHRPLCAEICVAAVCIYSL